MLTREKFYSHYDEIAPKIFDSYHKFLSIGAKAIPSNAESIYDLGIGTGNFSAAVKKRIPNLKVYGIDLQEDATKIAKSKIKDLEVYHGDIFSRPFPKVDYIISSLATHHFDNETRTKKLIQIANSSKGFVNFDVVLSRGQKLEDIINLVLSYAEKNFPDKNDLEQIRYEMTNHDNPMPLREHKKIFESLGMDFNILARKEPYMVYSVFKKE